MEDFLLSAPPDDDILSTAIASLKDVLKAKKICPDDSGASTDNHRPISLTSFLGKSVDGAGAPLASTQTDFFLTGHSSTKSLISNDFCFTK